MGRYVRERRGKGDSAVYLLSSEISFVQGELCTLMENGCILESTPSLHTLHAAFDSQPAQHLLVSCLSCVVE